MAQREVYGLRFTDALPTIGEVYRTVAGIVRFRTAVFSEPPVIRGHLDWTLADADEYESHTRVSDGQIIWDEFLIEKYLGFVDFQFFLVYCFETALTEELPEFRETTWDLAYYNDDDTTIEVFLTNKALASAIERERAVEPVKYPSLMKGIWLLADEPQGC